jgi:hypothetical protein
VVADSTWHRGVDYTIDRLRGEIRLLREPMPTRRCACACWLLAPPPLELQRMRYRAPNEAAADTVSVDPPSASRHVRLRPAGLDDTNGAQLPSPATRASPSTSARGRTRSCASRSTWR